MLASQEVAESVCSACFGWLRSPLPCHPERSEGPMQVSLRRQIAQVLRFAQHQQLRKRLASEEK